MSTVTMIPITENGTITWVEPGKRLKNLCGFGDTGDGANSAANILSKLSTQIGPASGGITQTDTGKASQDVQKYASLALKLAPALGVPVGPIVAGVAGIVIGAAKLVDAIGGTDKDKETLSKAGQVNQLNSLLRQQLIAVTQKTQQVSDALLQLDSSLKSVGLSGISNLGSLGNNADNILNQANATNAQLTQALDSRVQRLQSLIENFNSVVTQVSKAINGKGLGEKIILYGVLALSAIGLGVYAVRKLEHKEK